MPDDAIVNPGAIAEPHVHVVAAIVWQALDSRRFLIAQRPRGKHLEAYWELPGGKVESGESRLRALRREIAEEIGIEVERASPYMQVYYRYPERNVLLDTWWVEDYRGDVVAREGQRIAWIDIEQIEAYRFPPADIPILDAIRCSGKA